ncbi:MAG: hypothetical protein V3U62_09345 [Sedimenticolaceae bacterium]
MVYQSADNPIEFAWGVSRERWKLREMVINITLTATFWLDQGESSALLECASISPSHPGNNLYSTYGK